MKQAFQETRVNNGCSPSRAQHLNGTQLVRVWSPNEVELRDNKDKLRDEILGRKNAQQSELHFGNEKKLARAKKLLSLLVRKHASWKLEKTCCSRAVSSDACSPIFPNWMKLGTESVN